MQIKSFVAGAALAALVCSSAFAATLRVGCEPTFAPFEFKDSKTGAYEGFDMDLIREMGRRAGHKVEIVSMGFDALIPALSAKSLDVVASGVTITEERAQKVAFTAPYYVAGQGLLVRTADKDKYTDLNSLKDKTIAVQIGTTGAEMAAKVPRAKVKAFNATSEAFMDLRMKGSEAVLLDKPVIGYFMVVKPSAAKGLTLQPVVFEAESFGFAVRKGEDKLLDELNSALKAMREDGTYGKIYSKWFAQ
jgi:polar amino acid transport system substrate-binding protein